MPNPRTRTLGTLTDTDVKERRTITLGTLTGRLRGVDASVSMVSLEVDMGRGLIVWTNRLPKATPVEVRA